MAAIQYHGTRSLYCYGRYVPTKEDTATLNSGKISARPREEEAKAENIKYRSDKNFNVPASNECRNFGYKPD